MGRMRKEDRKRQDCSTENLRRDDSTTRARVAEARQAQRKNYRRGLTARVGRKRRSRKSRRRRRRWGGRRRRAWMKRRETKKKEVNKSRGAKVFKSARI